MYASLPAEMEEHIRFFYRRDLLKQCHDEMKVKVDPSTEGSWLFKQTDNHWRRPAPVDCSIGWGTEWSLGYPASLVRVENVGHRGKLVIRNIPIQRGSNFSYKYIERKEVEEIKDNKDDINDVMACIRRCQDCVVHPVQ